MNIEPALAVPGVVRVLTAADVPGVNDAGVKHDEPLFPPEIMFYGHAVCWVLGETLEAARLGAEAVEVEAEPLPSCITVTEAIAARSFQGAQPQVVRGDVDTALGEADRVFSGEFEFSGQEHFIPGDALRARPRRRGGTGVHPVEHSASLGDAGDRRPRPRPAQLRDHRAVPPGWAARSAASEMQPHGFARRSRRSARSSPAARCACGSTAPRIWTMSGKRHGFHADWRVGFDADGHLLALEATPTADGGWSLDLDPSPCWRGRYAISTTPTGSPTLGSTGGSPRRTRRRTRRSAALAAPRE